MSDFTVKKAIDVQIARTADAGQIKMPLGSITAAGCDVGLVGERQRFVRCTRQSFAIEASDDYPNSLTFQEVVGVANTLVADNG